MGNFIPNLIGCGPRYLELAPPEPRPISRFVSPCCMFYLTSDDPEACIVYLRKLKTAGGNLCSECCSQLPRILLLVKDDFERHHRFRAYGYSGPVLDIPVNQLATVLSGGWGVDIDRMMGTDMVRTFCELLEQTAMHTPGPWAWLTVLQFVDEGLDARNARTLILRTLWKERRRSQVRMHGALTCAGRVMYRAGVPRDVRLIVYRMVGAPTRQAWHAWSKRLAALAILWENHFEAMDACTEAQWALESVVRNAYSSSDHGDHRVLMDVLEGTVLYSRSAWLHWVRTTRRKPEQDPAEEAESDQ